MASGLIQVLNPMSAGENEVKQGLVPPFLAPPDTEAYTLVQSDATITSPGEYPVAQFATPPDKLAKTISVYFPGNVQQPAEGEVAFTILSSIRYAGDSHSVLITTARPSPDALSRPLVLGTREVTLSNGVTAWVSTWEKGSFPNWISFIQDDLIITVAGHVSVDELRELAAGVILK